MILLVARFVHADIVKLVFLVVELLKRSVAQRVPPELVGALGDSSSVV